MTLRFTVADSPDFPGLYSWELSDRGITENGLAPTISRCLTEIAAARLRIDRATHGDPEPVPPTHPTPDDTPPAQLQTPGGITLSAQQDIPATPHHTDFSAIFYLRPSKSG